MSSALLGSTFLSFIGRPHVLLLLTLLMTPMSQPFTTEQLKSLNDLGYNLQDAAVCRYQPLHVAFLPTEPENRLLHQIEELTRVQLLLSQARPILTTLKHNEHTFGETKHLGKVLEHLSHTRHQLDLALEKVRLSLMQQLTALSRDRVHRVQQQKQKPSPNAAPLQPAAVPPSPSRPPRTSQLAPRDLGPQPVSLSKAVKALSNSLHALQSHPLPTTPPPSSPTPRPTPTSPRPL